MFFFFYLSLKGRISSEGKYIGNDIILLCAGYRDFSLKKKSTKVTCFVQYISLVCLSPAMDRAWTRGVTSKYGGFLVNWGHLWQEATFLSASEDENIKALFIVERTHNWFLVIKFFFFSVNSSCYRQLTAKRLQVVNLGGSKGKAKSVL